MSAPVTEVVITRVKQYKEPNRSAMFAWKWLYEYSLDGAPSIMYGTGLTDLRDMLKRRFRPTSIRCDWRAAA